MGRKHTSNKHHIPNHYQDFGTTPSVKSQKTIAFCRRLHERRPCSWFVPPQPSTNQPVLWPALGADILAHADQCP